MMEGCIDLTGAAGAAQRGGAGKRPASPTTGLCDARTQKRSKDTFGEALVNTRAGQPLPSRAQPRPKRGLSDDDSLIAHDTCLAGEPAGNGGWRTGGAGSGGDGQRVLQASDLENSVASISGALRWRSPAKPHKLPRLLGPDQSRLPGLPTAVRGIVDVGADHPDHDDEQHHLHHQQGAVPVGASCQQHGNPQHPQHPHPHQRRHAQRGADSTACGARGGHSHQPAAGSGGGGDLSPGQPQPAPSQPPQSPAPAPQQHHEWGQLFSSLSLGGAGRGSQRTDPVWAAASSNRAAGGAGTRRPAVPGPEQHKAAGAAARVPGGAVYEPAAAAAAGAIGNGSGVGGSTGSQVLRQMHSCVSPFARAATAEATGGDAMEAERRDGAAEGVAATAAATAPGASDPGGDGRAAQGQGTATAIAGSQAGAPAGSPAGQRIGLTSCRVGSEVMDISPVKNAPAGQTLGGVTVAPPPATAEWGLGRAGSRSGFLAQEAGRLLGTAGRI